MSLNCIRYDHDQNFYHVSSLIYNFHFQMDPGSWTGNSVCNKYWIAKNFKIIINYEYGFLVH